jgi:hypothetical protein
MTDPMLLSTEEWMGLRAYRALRDAGATWAEIARETDHDWRTVKKYISPDAPDRPPALTARRPATTKMIDPYTALIDTWLTKERRLQATVIHQRLVADHGFSNSYQRVKLYVAEARERLWQAPPELYRRFEVLAGAQAQVDWGDEGFLETPDGAVHVGSFHMTLSFSRDRSAALSPPRIWLVTYDPVASWSLAPELALLATHQRSRRRGAWVVERSRWDGLTSAPIAGLHLEQGLRRVASMDALFGPASCPTPGEVLSGNGRPDAVARRRGSRPGAVLPPAGLARETFGRGHRVLTRCDEYIVCRLDGQRQRGRGPSASLHR